MKTIERLNEQIAHQREQIQQRDLTIEQYSRQINVRHFHNTIDISFFEMDLDKFK
jgi:hypothetical protein